MFRRGRDMWLVAVAMLLLAGCSRPELECSSDADCEAGSACDVAYGVCVSTCGDTSSDPNNCGACGNVCPTDALGVAVCSNGSCGVECSAGHAQCGTQSCQDLSTRATCGASCTTCNLGVALPNAGVAGCCAAADSSDNSCDAPCTAGDGADACSCRFTCVAGFADCDLDAEVTASGNGCEVQLSSGSPDGQGGVTHCGACNVYCSPYPRTSTGCANGTCQWTCDALTQDCDGVITNGCEPLNTSSNCGACGASCPGPGAANVASASCTSGSCVVSCATGWGNCDGDMGNGCETNLGTTEAHCGRCGLACTAPAGGRAICLNGTCSALCDPGFTDCGDVCYRGDFCP